MHHIKLLVETHLQIFILETSKREMIKKMCLIHHYSNSLNILTKHPYFTGSSLKKIIFLDM